VSDSSSIGRRMVGIYWGEYVCMYGELADGTSLEFGQASMWNE